MILTFRGGGLLAVSRAFYVLYYDSQFLEQTFYCIHSIRTSFLETFASHKNELETVEPSENSLLDSDVDEPEIAEIMNQSEEECPLRAHSPKLETQVSMRSSRGTQGQGSTIFSFVILRSKSRTS